MVLDTSEGTLHFFVNGEQCPGYIFNLPDAEYRGLMELNDGSVKLHSAPHLLDTLRQEFGNGFRGDREFSSEDGPTPGHNEFAEPDIVHCMIERHHT